MLVASGDFTYQIQGTYEKGDFASVERFINTEIIQKGKTASLTELHSIYGLCIDYKRYTYRLKQLIESRFGEKNYIFVPKKF